MITIEMRAYDPVADSQKTIYLANGHYISKPDDPTLASQPFRTWLDYSFDVETSPEGGFWDWSGGPRYGGFRVERNSENQVWFGWNFKHQEILIKEGERSSHYDDLTTIHRGLILEDPQADGNVWSFTLGDFGALLEQRVNSSVYDGSNPNTAPFVGAEGDEALEGKLKPMVFGEVFGIEPKQVNKTGQVWQVSDGQVNAITAVYDVVGDNKNALTSAGNMAQAAFEAWTPVPGEYVTDSMRGLIRLGGNPGGDIAADVQGYVGPDGYLNTHGGIIRVLAKRAGLTRFDLASFSAHVTAESAIAGIYISDGPTYYDVIRRLLKSCRSLLFFDPEGNMVIRQIDAPSITADQSLINTRVWNLVRAEVLEPVNRLGMSHGPLSIKGQTVAPPDGFRPDPNRNNSLLGPSSNGAGGGISTLLPSDPTASAFDIPVLESPYLDAGTVYSPNPATAAQSNEDEPPTFEGFYSTKPAAQTALDEQFALRESKTAFWTVSSCDPPTISAGQTINVHDPASGLDALNYVFIGVTRRSNGEYQYRLWR